VPWCTGVLGAATFGGIRIGANLLQGRPWHENVGRDAAIGGAIGLTLGVATPAALRAAGGGAAAEASTSFSAASLAGEVAEATGGAVAALARSSGYKVTVSAGGRDIVARIKEGGDFRVAIEGLGALTRGGAISSDRAQTHLTGATAEEVTRLMRQAVELLNARRP
jgi:hypothetical protein